MPRPPQPRDGGDGWGGSSGHFEDDVNLAMVTKDDAGWNVGISPRASHKPRSKLSSRGDTISEPQEPQNARGKERLQAYKVDEKIGTSKKKEELQALTSSAQPEISWNDLIQTPKNVDRQPDSWDDVLALRNAAVGISNHATLAESSAQSDLDQDERFGKREGVQVGTTRSKPVRKEVTSAPFPPGATRLRVRVRVVLPLVNQDPLYRMMSGQRLRAKHVSPPDSARSSLAVESNLYEDLIEDTARVPYSRHQDLGSDKTAHSTYATLPRHTRGPLDLEKHLVTEKYRRRTVSSTSGLLVSDKPRSQALGLDQSGESLVLGPDEKDESENAESKTRGKGLSSNADSNTASFPKLQRFPLSSTKGAEDGGSVEIPLIYSIKRSLNRESALRTVLENLKKRKSRRSMEGRKALSATFRANKHSLWRAAGN